MRVWVLIVAALMLIGCDATVRCWSCLDTTGPIAVCAPDLSDEDLTLAEEVWSAYRDCEDPESVPVDIASTGSDRVGLYNFDPRTGARQIFIDPSAWDQRPRETIAHELGHALGHDDEEGDQCQLMNWRVSPSSCEFICFHDDCFER